MLVCVGLGTCQSVGCTVDGSHPHDVIDKVNAGELEVPEVRMLYHTFSHLSILIITVRHLLLAYLHYGDCYGLQI